MAAAVLTPGCDQLAQAAPADRDNNKWNVI
jgi:hypothetical protein